MFRILRWLGYFLALAAGVIVVGWVLIHAASAKKLARVYVVEVAAPHPGSDAAAWGRGRHIAETRGCLVCHGADAGGARIMDNFAMGRVYGPNLTTGHGGRPANFRGEDWVRAVRHGVGPNGRPLFLMPAEDYAGWSDADLNDVIAYLTSLPPVDRPSVPLDLGPVARTLLVAGKIRLAADVIDHAHVHPSSVPPGVTAAYGRYLAGSCVGCHRDSFSGGRIAGGPPSWPPAANLTPSGDLGKWTKDDFVRALRTARRPDGSTINPVMPAQMGGMTDDELKALWMYLRTLPAATTQT